jgi:hypothetical protein
MYGLGLTHSPMFTYPAETGRSFCPYTQLKTDLVERGLRPELARVTIARRIAAVTLAVWKRGEAFDADKLIKHEV